MNSPDKMPEPSVSVLMAVYNGDRHLGEAIESILTQRYADFEFLIINDGSTDGTSKILAEYACRDSRIRIIENDENCGLAHCLNKGIALARGKYVARMDCDDISLPQRLEMQVAFMESHPEVGVCGTWYKIFGDRAGAVSHFPTSPDAIRCTMLFNSMLAHPSVIMRRELFHEHNLYYDPACRHAQDYELWSRVLKRFSAANIGTVLVMYRSHLSQVSSHHADSQNKTSGQVRLAFLSELGLVPDDDDFSIHQALGMINGEFFVGKNAAFARSALIHADSWLAKLKFHNDRAGIYAEPVYSRCLLERWLIFYSLAVSIYGLTAFRPVMPLHLFRATGMGVLQICRILLSKLADSILDLRYLPLGWRYNAK